MDKVTSLAPFPLRSYLFGGLLSFNVLMARKDEPTHAGGGGGAFLAEIWLRDGVSCGLQPPHPIPLPRSAHPGCRRDTPETCTPFSSPPSLAVWAGTDGRGERGEDSGGGGPQRRPFSSSSLLLPPASSPLSILLPPVRAPDNKRGSPC